MTQLILDVDENNVQLPESKNGGYAAQKEPLSQSVTMISGRTVREVRGNVWMLNYQYGFFDDEAKAKLMAACDKGVQSPIYCGFLTQESTNTLIYDYFWVESYTRPKFMWSTITSDGTTVSAKPLWADFSITLRGVNPID